MFIKEPFRSHVNSFKDISTRSSIDFRLFEKKYNNEVLSLLNTNIISKIKNLKNIKTFAQFNKEYKNVEDVIRASFNNKLPAPVLVQFPDKSIHVVLYQEMLLFARIFNLQIKGIFIEIKPEDMTMKK